MAITFNTEAIRLITLFENLTGVFVKDCIVDNSSNTVFFVVEEGKLALAIGKNGSGVKRAEKIIGKKIKLFEFSKELSNFIKNLIPSAMDIKIRNENNKTIAEVKVRKNDKALIIGREGRNLKLYKELLQRNHKVDELIIR